MDPEMRDRIRPAGGGQYGWAAGGNLIADARGTGADGDGGVGYALVLGAADWRRCGITSPVPASLLRALAAPHLGTGGRAALAEQRTYHAGLVWATGAMLLQPAGPRVFTVDEYVLDLIWARGVTIPEGSWQVAIENASTAELLRIGSMALGAYGEPDIAARAWRKAADRGGAVEALAAMANLGELLQEQGDIAGA